MYKQTVELEGENLQLTWEGKDYQQFSILQNGNVVATIPNRDQLRSGQRVVLPSRKEIMVIVTPSHGLELWHNGKEYISDSVSGTIDYFRKAGYGLMTLGVVQLIYGLIVLVGTMGAELGLWFGILVCLWGLAFIGLGYWGYKTYKKLPYWIGMGLTITDLLLFLSIFSVIILGSLAYYCYKATQSTPPKHLVVDEASEILPFDQV